MIVAEGKVANFLLATAAVIDFHHSLVSRGPKIVVGLNLKVIIAYFPFLSHNMLSIGQEALFLLLTLILRMKFDTGLAKVVGPNSSSKSKLSNEISDILPFVSMAFLPFLVYLTSRTVIPSGKKSKPFLIITFFNYLLIALHWICKSDVGKYLIPRMVYIIDFGMLLLLIPVRLLRSKKNMDDYGNGGIASITMLCGLSSTILLLSGTQGPAAALIFVTGGTESYFLS